MFNDPLLVIGIIGSVLSLIVFSLNQLGTLSTKSIWYDGANALGAVLLLGYAVREEAWPFVLTNTVWFLVSFVDVLTWFRANVLKKR